MWGWYQKAMQTHVLTQDMPPSRRKEYTNSFHFKFQWLIMVYVWGGGETEVGGAVHIPHVCVEVRRPHLHGVSFLHPSSPGFRGSDPDYPDLVASTFTS